MAMAKFIIIHTTHYTLSGQQENWSLSVGGQDFVNIDHNDLTTLQTFIGEIMATPQYIGNNGY